MDEFQAELEALSAYVHHVARPEMAAQKVIEILQEEVATEVLAWSEETIGIAGLREALQAAGVVWHEAETNADPSAYRHVRVGLTGADAGLADTGALVLVSGPGRARLASLLPPVHVAILTTQSLYSDMVSFWAAQPDAIRRGSNLVFIAGPSRTADIEMTLTLGMHGPRAVHVVLVA
jgi:L-lactate dehydrogenase complex protein LldG